MSQSSKNSSEDAELFLEAKRSAGLHAEFEKLSNQLLSQTKETEQARADFIALKEKYEDALINIEACKEEILVHEAELSVTFESIKSLQVVLREVQETTAKLVESEKEHSSLLQNLEKDNYYCQMKIPSLEERIREVFEEAKLVKLEKQAGEEDLKRQREESLDQLISLQRECEKIKAAIKAIEKEIVTFEIEEGVTRASHPLVKEKEFAQHVCGSPMRNRNLNKKMTSSQPNLDILDVESVIAELVSDKISGLEEMVRAHVEKRFLSLEKDMYAKSVQYPVYSKSRIAALSGETGIDANHDEGGQQSAYFESPSKVVRENINAKSANSPTPKQPPQPVPSKSVTRNRRQTSRKTVDVHDSNAESERNPVELSRNSRWSEQMKAIKILRDRDSEATPSSATLQAETVATSPIRNRSVSEGQTIPSTGGKPLGSIRSRAASDSNDGPPKIIKTKRK